MLRKGNFLELSLKSIATPSIFGIVFRKLQIWEMLMKSVILLMFTFSSLMASATHNNVFLSTCEIEIAIANTDVDSVKELAEKGQATNLEVAIAEVALLETRFNCRNIYFINYCELLIPKQQFILNAVQDLFKVGEIPISKVKKAEKNLTYSQNICR